MKLWWLHLQHVQGVGKIEDPWVWPTRSEPKGDNLCVPGDAHTEEETQVGTYLVLQLATISRTFSKKIQNNPLATYLFV